MTGTLLQRRRKKKKKRNTKKIRKNRIAKKDALIPLLGKTPEKRRKNKKKTKSTRTNPSPKADHEAEKENKQINKTGHPSKIRLNHHPLSLEPKKLTSSKELKK